MRHPSYCASCPNSFIPPPTFHGLLSLEGGAVHICVSGPALKQLVISWVEEGAINKALSSLGFFSRSRVSAWGVEGRRNGNRIFKKLRQGIITWRIPPPLKPQTGVPDFRPTTTPVVKGLYVSRTPLRVSWFGGSLKAASSSTS